MSNTRIRFIFWLMTICIVAINAFQGYWLLTTYRLNRAQFKQTVQEVLFQVVEGQQIARADALFGENARKPGSPGPPSSQIIVRKFRSGGNAPTRVYVHSGIPVENPLPEDTLARRISKLLVMGWAEGGQVDKRKLFRAYRYELERRGISAAFLIDTLRIKPESDGKNIVFFNSGNEGRIASGQFKTAPVPINPVKNLFVQATFDTPFAYLFRKMSGLLAASFLLLLLTSGCFIYMLRTILRQKRLAEIKNDFINNMTHELKTPIATVTAAVDAMLHYGVLEDPARTKSYLSISQNNLSRLSELVEKVLNLAVEDKQEMKLQPEPVNLYSLVTELADNYRIKSGKPVSFDLHIPENAIVSVDRMHFGNVLSNLIDNAIKYSHEQVNVIFRFREEARGWYISVADNGMGIAKHYQQAVFDRFFRVPTGNLHAIKGFGLGLAYVRQVVERHGGTIDLVSEPGKGSEFILRF